MYEKGVPDGSWLRYTFFLKEKRDLCHRSNLFLVREPRTHKTTYFVWSTSWITSGYPFSYSMIDRNSPSVTLVTLRLSISNTHTSYDFPGRPLTIWSPILFPEGRYHCHCLLRVSGRGRKSVTTGRSPILN